MSFIDVLKWRGLIQDITPGVEDVLNNPTTRVSAYVGIDPTADSLHIGHLVSIMLLKHFQNSGSGHTPIILVGGATGMIGDPSGKSTERNLLDKKTLEHNKRCIKEQLSKFLKFDGVVNSAEIVDNYDWMKEFSFINFIRDIGKHITVNYMMAKDSVKKRLSTETREGMSFTEFSYQLLQGYDFYYLRKHKNCKIQLGGADQWGNITTGMELIRKIDGIEAEAYGITCPLIKKSDGTKFGKTEKGNIWLDPNKTSPFEFYQFWYNLSDEDAEKYIKIYTTFSKDETENDIQIHKENPGLRHLQKTLAREVTIMVHGRDGLKQAVIATSILFGNDNDTSVLKELDENNFNTLISSLPTYEISRDEVISGENTLEEILAIKTNCFRSKSEVKRAIKEGSLYLNLNKVTKENYLIGLKDLIKNYLIIKRGKKNWYIIKTITL